MLLQVLFAWWGRSERGWRESAPYLHSHTQTHRASKHLLHTVHMSHWRWYNGGKHSESVQITLCFTYFLFIYGEKCEKERRGRRAEADAKAKTKKSFSAALPIFTPLWSAGEMKHLNRRCAHLKACICWMRWGWGRGEKRLQPITRQEETQSVFYINLSFFFTLQCSHPIWGMNDLSEVNMRAGTGMIEVQFHREIGGVFLCPHGLESKLHCAIWSTT